MKTKKRIYTWSVVINYSCNLGDRGEVVSRHTSYELAAAALRRSIYADHLRLDEIFE